MEHKMNLQDWPFYAIKNGTKKIEMRLYDEKRQKIKVGDIIVFANQQKTETICTKVVALHLFKNFAEIYQKFPKEWLGYKSDEIAKPEDMEQFYPAEEIAGCGVVGIEIQLMNK